MRMLNQRLRWRSKFQVISVRMLHLKGVAIWDLALVLGRSPLRLEHPCQGMPRWRQEVWEIEAPGSGAEAVYGLAWSADCAAHSRRTHRWGVSTGHAPG